jgi:UDP-glucose 4-epimerase
VPEVVQGKAGHANEARYRGAKVMVTGGLGFIGSNLARRLVDIGARVIVLDAMLPNFGGNLANLEGVADRLEIHIANLSERDTVAELVRGCDFIFNLAGHVSHIDSMTDPETDLDANVRAQIIFLEACRRHAPDARIAFSSTRQIYGRPQYLPVDERHPLRPVDVNGINKMAAEAYHTLYHEVYGLRTVSLRLTNTYGPRLRVKDARQTFLGLWLRRVVEHGVFEVWGGAQRRDLCYVDDVIDAFLRAALTDETAGKIFNLGGCPPVTLLSLAEMLVATAGSGQFECREFPAARKQIDIGDYFADDAHFRSVTGWQPRVDLADGLARSVAYYRQHLPWYV